MALRSTAMGPSPLREAALREAPLGSTRRFVVFPLGGEPYALDSGSVLELDMAARVYRFPHATPALEGVLVKRGAAIPVCDLGRIFAEQGPRTLFVIARCRYQGAAQLVAIPVRGSCELLEGEPVEAAKDSAAAETGESESGQAPPKNRAPEVTFVAGLLRTPGRTVPLLDLDRVVAHCMQAPMSVHREGRK